jgi:carboxylesterase
MIHSRRRTLATQRMLGDDDPRPFSAEGRAPAVLALHGFTGTVSELRPLVESIASAGYAVRAPLLPGHGTACVELQSLSFDTFVDAAREEARALAQGHARVIVLGFSLGSLVAMQLAAENVPGLAGLVAMGSATTLPPYTRWPLGLLSRAKIELPDWYLLKPFAADMTDRAAAKRIATYDRHPMRAALEVYRAGKRVRAIVGRITCPTLILHGARDRVCSTKSPAFIASRLGTRDVRVRMFPKSAHVIACDVEKADVAREVLDFLARFSKA